jgi:hypothetical protein
MSPFLRFISRDGSVREARETDEDLAVGRVICPPEKPGRDREPAKDPPA